MKSHREMFEALLAGETLIDRRYACQLINKEVKFYVDGEELLDETDKCIVRQLWFGSVEKWSIKTKTININGFEVPEPIKVLPKIGLDNVVYCVSLVHCENVIEIVLHEIETYALNRLLHKGLLHLTKEAALLHAKALLSFTAQHDPIK